MQDDGLYLISRPPKLSPVAGTLQRMLGSYIRGGLYARDCDHSDFRVRFALEDTPRTEYHEGGFDDWPSRYATITKLQIGVLYYAINDYCWTGATWDGVDHTHVQCTVTPYIRYNGNLYFGTPAEFGADNAAGHESDPPADEYLTRLKTVCHNWETNPETSAGWTAEDRKKITFGARIEAPDETIGLCIIYELWARFYFTGAKSTSEEFEYVKLSPVEDSLALSQWPQTPIKADELDFTIRDAPPERSEIALIKDGLIVFQGIIWTVKDGSNDNQTVLAKSQQVLLNHRLLGQLSAPTDGNLTVADIFADKADYTAYAVAYYRGLWAEPTQLDDTTWIVLYAFNIPAGLFYANSWLGEFKTARILGDQAMLESGEAETYIRAGTNDMGDYELPAIPDTHGVAATVFSDIFKKFGQEVRYRYWWDGKVYQDAAVEIANGSADEPCIEVVDGPDGTVTKRVSGSPNPTAAIGSALNPKVSCAWARARQYFLKIFSSSKIAADLQEYLDSQIDVDDSLYEVSLQSEIWTLRPGDYMAVQPRDDALTPVRIRQIATGKGKTAILAGKRLLSLDEQFGVWRDAKYAGHNYTDLKTTEIDESTNLTLSKEFTISSDDLANPGWQCVAMIDWDFVMRNLIYENLEEDWSIIYRTNSNPAKPEVYIQVYGESYNAYGPHTYEFYITRNMGAIGVEPYGQYDVDILVHGRFKWRKDGGAWSDEIVGFDIWHPTEDYSADLGNGLYAQVIFVVDPGGTPWMTPEYTNVLGQSASVYACETLDLSAVPKCLILKMDGKPIPPGRYLAQGEKDSMEVDITEFCNVAGTYTLSAQMVNGRAYSTYNNYYHVLSGRITQSCHDKPGAA
jgi:hypothetical protein